MSDARVNRNDFARPSWILAILVFVFLLMPFVRFYFFNNLGRWLYILIFSFSASYVLTPVARITALKLGILDFVEEAGGRKIHEQNTPLLGGLAIIIAFIAALLANMILDREYLLLLVGGVIVALVSLIDDWRGLSAKLKLGVQVAVVIVLIYQGVVLELFPVKTLWGYALNCLFTVLWIVGITNAMNFADGMDGLAAGLGAIIALFMGIVAFQTSQPLMGWVALAMLGSCLGFLPYNFRPRGPALIFLGDGGSIFLGFILASLAIKGEWADNNPIVSFAAPVLIFWVLIFDMIYITVERILNGKVKSVRDWIDYVGKDHMHHRFYALLGDRRKAVLFIFLIAATLGISAIALRNARIVDGILLVTQAFLITIIISVLEYSGRHRS
jgi:UDP-GlcNAc:undecaprenyl-phosphate/decaprenyl-phosphate GlcNAc-1-phosphate transferase